MSNCDAKLSIQHKQSKKHIISQISSYCVFQISLGTEGIWILHLFLAFDIFESWQNLKFSPFNLYEGGKKKTVGNFC